MNSCANCRYGVTATTQAAGMAPVATTTCHATPPQAASNGNAIWPVVLSSDWCGAFVNANVAPKTEESSSS